MLSKPLLEWTSFPFSERPWTSVILVLFLMGLCWIMWHLVIVQWGYPIFYIGGIALVFGSLLPYFIPTKYELHDDKITVYYAFVRIERKYTDFGCFYTDKRGVLLSTFKTPRRLDTFRGQSLRFSEKQSEKEPLLTLLKEKIGKQY
jgi:hypothetical protein